MGRVNYLQDELLLRKRRNPRYSLRAYARDLGVSPSSLSRLCRGAQSPGIELLRKLIASKDTTPELKQRLALELALGSNVSTVDAPLERVAIEPKDLLDPPERCLIFLYARLNDFILDDSKTLKAVAQRLGVTKTLLKTELRALEEIGLLIRDGDGKIRTRADHHFVPTTESKATIRAFHRSMIKRALHAMDDTSQSGFVRREISAETLTFDPEDMESVRLILAKCKEDIVRLTTKKRGKELYQLNLQFFPLTQASDSR